MKSESRILKIEAKKSISNMNVFLVVNTKMNTKINSDYTDYSIATEFYSDIELNDLLDGFRDCGVYTEVVWGEDHFIKKVLAYEIKNDKHTIVFNSAQNGKGPGRKSLIPSYCNYHNIKITGSNAYVVSLCRNKYHLNKLLEAHNMPVPKSWLYSTTSTWLNNLRPKTGLEVIAKPIYESASIGISDSSKFIYTPEMDNEINELSSKLEQPIIVQEFIRGFEVETPVITFGNIHCAPISIGIAFDNKKWLDDKFLTYDDIYSDNYSFYNFNEAHADVAGVILNVTKSVAQIINIEGLGRVDFRVTQNGELFITDVSTNPHLVEHSSYQYLFQELELKHSDLFKILIQSTLSKY